MTMTREEAIQLTYNIYVKFSPDREDWFLPKLFGLAYWFQLEELCTKDDRVANLVRSIAQPHGYAILKALEHKKEAVDKKGPEAVASGP